MESRDSSWNMGHQVSAKIEHTVPQFWKLWQQSRGLHLSYQSWGPEDPTHVCMHRQLVRGFKTIAVLESLEVCLPSIGSSPHFPPGGTTGPPSASLCTIAFLPLSRHWLFYLSFSVLDIFICHRPMPSFATGITFIAVKIFFSISFDVLWQVNDAVVSV